jgi:DNA-binding NtrC family response regulator
VRELINLIRRVVALAPGNEIGPEAWTDFEPIAPDCQADRLEPGLSLVHVEKRLFELTLEATGGNRSRAAEMLGVSLRTVRNKVRDYGLPSRRSYGHE